MTTKDFQKKSPMDKSLYKLTFCGVGFGPVLVVADERRAVLVGEGDLLHEPRGTVRQ